MRQYKAVFKALPLMAVAALLAGCSAGMDMNRQLESISITPTTGSGNAVSYTAAGTFNAAPTTVTPLPVSWYIMGPAIDPPGPGYSLTNADYIAHRCGQINLGAVTYTVVAVAPADPHAPISGPMSSQTFSDLVISHTKTSEDGFVAGTAKLGCS